MKTHRLFPIGWLCALVFFLLLACRAVTSLPTSLAPIVELAPTSLAPLIEPEPTPSLQPTPRIQCPAGDCAQACIDKLTSVLQGSGSLSSPKGIPSHNQNPKTILLVTYEIHGDQISSPRLETNIPPDLVPYQQDAAEQQKIWVFFSAIIPLEQRPELKEFLISTDGKGNMLASVEQSTNNPADWALNVDPVDAGKPQELTYTLVHEFGHLLTLNEGQVSPDMVILAHPDDPQIQQREAASCPQFFASDGCSKPDSYINRFFQNFWPKIFNEWNQVNAEKDQANYLYLLGRFYEIHHTQFVSPYAATSPEEDIAESWARFVLTPKPAPESIADQKILFFYQYPELVQLRDQIVYGLCNYALNP